MTKKTNWLKDFSKNITSQHGEDGIIEKILEIIPENNKWCVEFGAWDGKFLSNTYNLIKNYNFNGILIESCKEKADEIKYNYSSKSHIIVKNDFVGFTSNNNLDKLLADTNIPIDFDFLSIDINGNDYYTWKATKKYQPKVVCIEYNPTISNEVEFVQPPDNDIFQGASLLSIYKLGKEKGYELVCVTDTNAIMVDKKYYSLFNIQDNSPVLMNKNNLYLAHIFVGYDGKIFLSGADRLLWHGNKIKIKQLPKYLRKPVSEYNFFEKIYHKILLKFD